jgi:D-glycero-alpha-D-manno-heptose-7-phosphate kinase
MIITQTPLRISFFGGGTDYPEYFLKHGGAVLGTAINKFAFFSISHFYSALFDYSIRLAYRQVECVKSVDDIQHVPFRECLRWCGINKDVEIDLAAELPSYTGLGSSSSFIVGLLNTIYAFQGRLVPPMELAYQAIEIERNVLKECVGCQDQTFAAMGGFNFVEFHRPDYIVVNRLPISHERLREFEEHLVLTFTGIRRRAQDVTTRQVEKIAQNVEHLQAMRKMVDEGYTILLGQGSLAPFGELLHQSWLHKRLLDSAVSNDRVDEIYQAGREAGALGGKLLGAGGGGFILFFVPPEKKSAVCQKLSQFPTIPIQVNACGTHIIHA